MRYVGIGTDEAGYGPNLGPLVVSATRWNLLPPHENNSRFSDQTTFDSLDEMMNRFTVALAECCGTRGVLPITDSKKIYHSGELAPLERSVLGLAATLSFLRNGDATIPTTFSALLRHWTGKIGEDGGGDSEPPWETDADVAIPTAKKTGTIADLTVRAKLAAGTFCAKKIVPVAIVSRRIHPEEFNRRLEKTDSKSDLLANITFQLAAAEIAAATEEWTEMQEAVTILWVGDKLGGRNQYAPILRSFFSDTETIVTLAESRAESRYQMIRPGQPTVEVRFRAKGESFPPTAAASMVSKYLRELSMLAFNRFWSRRVPNLSPTAGYPVDAKRFLAEIRPALSALNLKDATLWRRK